MTRIALRLALALAAFHAAGAFACGVCLEDKVAATYDHAIAARASARGQVMVFAEAATGVEAHRAARALRAAAARLRGVDAASVRTAPAPLTLSFALDPRVASAEAALAGIARAAALPGLQLTLLKVER